MKQILKLCAYFSITILLAFTQTVPVRALDQRFYAGNDILYYDPDAKDPCVTSTAGSAVSGNSNIAKMWNYLTGKGLTGEQAAGILGNIQEESEFSPFRHETGKPWEAGGYGIVQWTDTRRTEIVNKMNAAMPDLMQKYYKEEYGKAASASKGYVPDGIDVDVNDKFLTFQLDFLYQESTTRKVRSGIGAPSGITEWEAIKSSKTIKDASNIWLLSFERPKDQSAAHQDKRAANGEKIFEDMKNLPQTSIDSQGNNTGPPASTGPPSHAGVTYLGKSIGNIPAEGKSIGASTFGGEWSARLNRWVSTNNKQGVEPGFSSDDNGEGNTPKGIAGSAGYAELSTGRLTFNSLGKLPNFTKLEISYNGKSIIAEKRDVGQGQPGNKAGGKTIDIDLWWEAAKLLDFKGGNGVVHVRPVTDSTPTTPVSGAATTSTTTTTAVNKGVIFLDPGHGGAISRYTDEKSGLVAAETYSTPETENMLKVANRVKTELEKNGFTVVLSRTTDTQKLTARERAEAAIAAKAAIGISLHSNESVNQAWAQREGAYRQYQDKRVTFSNKTTAAKSQQYNAAIAKARAAAEGREVGLDENGSQQKSIFNRESVASKGDIPLVSLFAETIPWSYNEFAHGSDGKMDEGEIARYTKGIVDGVVAANPAGAGATSGGCPEDSSSFAGGDLSATTLAYAWPTYKGKGGDATKAKPEYEAAVAEAQKLGQYIGGTISTCGKRTLSDGVDCGGFVTRLVVNSGWEPHYNYDAKGGPTDTQEKWLRENWQRLGKGSEIDTGTLKPGDVAMLPGHTFIYVGDIPGFSSKIASASLCERAPVAGRESLTKSDTTWYRKK